MTTSRPTFRHALGVIATVSASAALLASCGSPSSSDTSAASTVPSTVGTNAATVAQVQTVVVIFAENRAFDNLYGLYPGANGIPGVNPSAVGDVVPQKDFDGSVLPVLPPTWGGLTAGGQKVTLTQQQSANMPNKPFRIDSPEGLNGSGTVVSQDVVTRDLVHRFYSNMMQISGGRNDRFAAYSDAGGLSMGYYDGSSMQLWKLAQQYVLADNFFMGAFGGSFLNHQYLVCACVPKYPNADTSPAKGLVTAIDTDAEGNFLRHTPAADAKASVLAGPPHYLKDGALTPKDADGMWWQVNTMQPAFQPSGNVPAKDGDPRLADRSTPSTSPPLSQVTIGDRLTDKGVSWAWYGGAWNAAGAGTKEARALIYGTKINFQSHHQPFNYYASWDPIAHPKERAEHLRDFDSRFEADMTAGKLPAVTFYKPQGNLNQHAGYASVGDGDKHIASVISRLQGSPQWPNMLIIVTYDENGGFYDHAPVPRGDRWGPGTRVPAIIVSPLAKRGFVDKTQYDTASILRFITRRWSLEPLPGVVERDAGLRAHGYPAMGDLSAALVAPSMASTSPSTTLAGR